VLHIAVNDSEEIIHYNETVINKVNQSTILPFVGEKVKKELKKLFDDFPVVAWRLLNTPENRKIFKKIKAGDEILITEGDNVKFFGTFRIQIINEELADKYENLFTTMLKLR
jgi:uncharacterized phage-associated protein